MRPFDLHAHMLSITSLQKLKTYCWLWVW